MGFGQNLKKILKKTVQQTEKEVDDAARQFERKAASEAAEEFPRKLSSEEQQIAEDILKGDSDMAKMAIDEQMNIKPYSKNKPQTPIEEPPKVKLDEPTVPKNIDESAVFPDEPITVPYSSSTETMSSIPKKGKIPRWMKGTALGLGAGASAYGLYSGVGESEPRKMMSTPEDASQVPPEKMMSTPDDAASYQDPMGMAESLPQRSGDDMMKNRKISTIKNLIQNKEITPEQALKILDVGSSGFNSSNEELKRLQDQENTSLLINNLARSANMIGAGMLKTKPVGDELYSANEKLIRKKTEDFKAQVENQKNDPKSPVSKAFRDYAKILGYDIKGDFSAADAEKVIPFLFKGFEADLERQADKEKLRLTVSENAKNRQLQREFIADQKEKDRETKRESNKAREDDKNERFIQSIRKEITTGDIGKMRSSYMTGKKGMTLLENAIKDPSGYKDFGSFFAAMKALQGDDSVIREAELRLGLSVGSIPEKMRASVSRFFTGQMLDPNQRKKLLESMKVLTDANKNQYLASIEPHIKQAKRLGMDISELTGVTNNDLKDTDGSMNRSIIPERDLEKVHHFMNNNNITDENEAYKILKKAGKVGN